jgi:hypothetical protein
MFGADDVDPADLDDKNPPPVVEARVQVEEEKKAAEPGLFGKMWNAVAS